MATDTRHVEMSINTFIKSGYGDGVSLLKENMLLMYKRIDADNVTSYQAVGYKVLVNHLLLIT
jgi:hypothetical protein